MTVYQKWHNYSKQGKPNRERRKWSTDGAYPELVKTTDSKIKVECFLEINEIEIREFRIAVLIVCFRRSLSAFHTMASGGVPGSGIFVSGCPLVSRRKYSLRRAWGLQIAAGNVFPGINPSNPRFQH